MFIVYVVCVLYIYYAHIKIFIKCIRPRETNVHECIYKKGVGVILEDFILIHVH